MATAVVVGTIALVGAGVSAYGQYQQGQAMNAIAQYNAAQQERQGRYQMMTAAAQANMMKKQAEANYHLRAAEANAKDANARQLEQQALSQDAVSRENARRRMTNMKRDAATQRQALATSGVVESTGTPLDLLAETAQTIQRDQAEQHYSNELSRRTLFREADLERLGGKFALAGATIDKSAALAESSLTMAKGRLSYLSSKREADITRMTGAANKKAANIAAAGTLISGASSFAGGFAKYG
jgi:hypothetical protein